MEKKWIIVYLPRKYSVGSIYDLDGPIEEFIEKLKTKKKEAEQDGFRNIIINFDTCDDGNYSYSEVNLRGERIETDKEYERRIKKAENVKLKEEEKKRKVIEKERKDYERLKKKFEGI